MAQYLDLTGLGHFKDKNDALYAKQDGSYEGMTVGNAEQLVSTVGVEDNAPYVFRTTGGSADVGDRMNLKAVVGGTVAWNQLVQNGNFANATGWSGRYSSVSVSGNIATVTPSSNGKDRGIYASTTEPSVIANHVYLLRIDCKPSGAVGLNLTISGGASYAAHHPINMTANTWNTVATMWKTANAGSYTMKLYALVNDSLTTSDSIQFRNANMFDLTAMFGSTIADYVHTLESGTAGAGVAWLKKYGWFTKPYYPYKAAALESVKTSAHKTIGFNQWDEEWERGGLPNGVPDSTVNKIRSKNYCRCVENTVYYGRISGTYSLTAWFYDANNNVIGSASASNRTFTTPNSACYFKLAFESVYGTSYNDDVCINISWDGERDGEYEPYEQHTYALDDVELRGILKLDASNNLYYDGDTYEADGTVTRRYGIVDLGTLTWNKGIGKTYFAATISGIKRTANWNTVPQGIKCPNYTQDTANNVSESTNDKTMSVAPNADTFVIYDSVYASYTKDAFKAAMSGVYLVYELATQTTESADAYTELQICNDFGTEEFVDAATRDFEMPCGSNAVYQPNLRAKLEMAPNSPSNGNGDYIVRQTDGVNEYVLFSEVKELPDLPTTDGTYTLKCTVADGTATLSWVSE